jgi:hypothetical protein
VISVRTPRRYLKVEIYFCRCESGKFCSCQGLPPDQLYYRIFLYFNSFERAELLTAVAFYAVTVNDERFSLAVTVGAHLDRVTRTAALTFAASNAKPFVNLGARLEPAVESAAEHSRKLRKKKAAASLLGCIGLFEIVN